MVIEPGKVEISNGKAKLSYMIRSSDKEEELWFSVDEKYGRFLCVNRCDTPLTALFTFAMRFNLDIECKGSVSDKLYYNLTYHIIPMIFNDNRGYAKEISIKADIKDKEYFKEAKGVATGLSCGVDSFYTLYEYTRDEVPEEYRITHLTYFQNGAHHGQIGRYDAALQKKIFDGQLNHVRSFCDEYGYELIVINSNLQDFIDKFFNFFEFDTTHTYRNMAFAMLLPGLIKSYYYASPSLHPLFASKCDLNKDVAYYEKLVLPLLSTEYFQGYSANRFVSRFDKVKALGKFPQCYDWLLVCLKNTDKNCGMCLKCKRTLAEIDLAGNLELFKNVFDIDLYNQHKQDIVYSICTAAIKHEDVFSEEMYWLAKKNKPEWFDCINSYRKLKLFLLKLKWH